MACMLYLMWSISKSPKQVLRFLGVVLGYNRGNLHQDLLMQVCQLIIQNYCIYNTVEAKCLRANIQ